MDRRVTISLRIPEDVHVGIKRVADREDRTITAQILRYIRAGLAQDQAQHDAPAKPDTAE